MNWKLVFLLLVILFCLFSTCNGGHICKEGFNFDEFEHVDGSRQVDSYFHVDTAKKTTTTTAKKTKKGHPSLLNIYGEPLQSCRKEGSDDTRGSWTNGYCDETGGGVHQICLEVDKTPSFSEKTGQGPWSDERQGKNHCMCLGAWSLYKARQEISEIDNITKTSNELHCESIMDDALQNKYVEKWNTWNGNELDDQIVHGVNKLMDQCYEQGNPRQKEHLKKLYVDLTKDKPEFADTTTFQTHTN